MKDREIHPFLKLNERQKEPSKLNKKERSDAETMKRESEVYIKENLDCYASYG